MSEKTKKVTFNLHMEILAKLDQVMAEGAALSKNALVERAIVKELRQVRREARKRRWEEGAKDPVLLQDISDIEPGFISAEAEAYERMDQYRSTDGQSR